jgi:hypothetical protein
VLLSEELIGLLALPNVSRPVWRGRFPNGIGLRRTAESAGIRCCHPGYDFKAVASHTDGPPLAGVILSFNLLPV